VNFIKRLQAENETRAAAIEAMERELNEVRRYLTSEKFQRRVNCEKHWTWRHGTRTRRSGGTTTGPGN
jgi:hypothetical protein